MSDISVANYAFLQQHVYRSCGIVLDDNKEYLVVARLLPIVRKEKLGSLDDLCALLRATRSGRVVQEVLDAMTTNETLFFRDAIPFQVLREQLLPELLKKKEGLSKRLAFWSAASSSGQEAYSLAMMLLEMGLENWNIEIVGTDLSEAMLERARSGRYSQLEVSRGLPARLLVKYFTREGEEWQLRDEVRRLVRFKSFDLRQPMASLGTFDFVICRNVLIYFDVETKRRILEQIAKTLPPGGYLLLGAAETTMNITDIYERRPINGASFYRRS